MNRITFFDWIKNLNEARGLYGQSEGPTQHSNSFYDRIDLDNRVAEGDFVHHLNKLIKARNWDAVQKYVDKLRADGHDINRLQSMITQAMYKAV